MGSHSIEILAVQNRRRAKNRRHQPQCYDDIDESDCNMITADLKNLFYDSIYIFTAAREALKEAKKDFDVSPPAVQHKHQQKKKQRRCKKWPKTPERPPDFTPDWQMVINE